MRVFAKLFSATILLSILFYSQPSPAQGIPVYPTAFNLRTSIASSQPSPFILLQGYTAKGDGGGGTFFYDSSVPCVASSLMGTWSTTDNTITLSSGNTSRFRVGYATATGQTTYFPDYDYVTSIPDLYHFTLAVKPSAAAATATAINLTCDNAGTAFGTNRWSLVPIQS